MFPFKTFYSMNIILNFINSLVDLLNAMSPYLLLGFFFAGILKAWFPQRWIDRYMGKSNWKSVINTAILGIPLPLCSCGVIPTGISFYRNGASKGSSVSFLISTPQTGVDSIMVTYSLLGLPFAIIRVIVALITGIIGGTFTNFTGKSDNIDSYLSNTCANDKMGVKNGFIGVFRYGFYEFLMDIAKWLIIGILIAAVLAVVIPDDFFSMYLNNELLSMLVVLLASVPLYLCATASVPIAAVLMLKGLSPGAALVLLMAGPATNAATITIINKVFGNKTLLAYLGSIILGALTFGLLINNLPREWFTLSSHAMHHAHHHELIPKWLQIISSITLVSLIANGYLQQYLKRRNIKDDNTLTIKMLDTSILGINKPDTTIQFSSFSVAQPTIKKTFIVNGMTCSHCKNSVENKLSKLANIISVNVDLQSKQLTLEGTHIDSETIKKEIEQLGYTYSGIKE